jgi:uncharacterized membrane protein YphA (DoxX/SURF4 family)
MASVIRMTVMRRYNRRFWIGCLVAALMPTAAWAHVKWFEDAARHPVRLDLVLSDRTYLWLGASTVALLWLSMAQRLLGGGWPELGCLRRMAAGAPTLLGIQAAICLASAAVQPALLASNLSLPRSPLGFGLAGLELVIAATLVSGIADWLGALALLGLVPVTALLYSPMDALEQGAWVGIAVTIAVVGRRGFDGASVRAALKERAAAWASRSVAILRISTGLAVIGAAVTEKLWNPALGAAFLAHHPGFNVFHTQLGLPWFTDDLFVLLAGIVEGIIGVLLVSGCLTRVVVLGMWLPFNLGIPFLPPQELIGHLPILATMYVLLVHGPGALAWSPGLATAARTLQAGARRNLGLRPPFGPRTVPERGYARWGLEPVLAGSTVNQAATPAQPRELKWWT